MKSKGSLSTAPAKTRRLWGDAIVEFDTLAAALNVRGFQGPLTWKEESLIPFSKELCPTVRVTLQLNVSASSDGVPHVWCSAILQSKTIERLTRPDDPWVPSDLTEPASPWMEGTKACLMVSLSHLKWCEAPSDINPSWPLTTSGVGALLKDLDKLMVPMLDRIESDDALEAVLVDALARVPPAWVKSSGPRFARLPQLLERLRSR